MCCVESSQAKDSALLEAVQNQAARWIMAKDSALLEAIQNQAARWIEESLRPSRSQMNYIF